MSSGHNRLCPSSSVSRHWLKVAFMCVLPFGYILVKQVSMNLVAPHGPALNSVSPEKLEVGSGAGFLNHTTGFCRLRAVASSAKHAPASEPLIPEGTTSPDTKEK